MKQTIKSIVFCCFTIVLTATLTRCNSMDDYLNYMEDGKPRSYTGLVDSIQFHSGEERIVFTGLLTSDPKITLVKIFWDSQKEHIDLDIERSAGVDTLTVEIPLPEGRYNFEVYSYDKEGNPSVPSHASAASYGEEYKKTLYSRIIKNVEKVGDAVYIEWYNGDESSPFVRIDYTDVEDKEQVYLVKTSETRTTLDNYKRNTKFAMSTWFLPDELAIDTFKTATEYVGVNENVTDLYIQNPGSPFYRGDDGTDKWGTVRDWKWSDNIINQNNSTKGGWSTDEGGVIHLESKDWGGEGVTNGKIYQTLELPAGKYNLEFYSDGGGSDHFEGNFLAAYGDQLPDIENVTSAIALHQWDQHNLGGTRSIEFTLEETSTVSIGWVVTFGSSTWMHINYVKLMLLVE